MELTAKRIRKEVSIFVVFMKELPVFNIAIENNKIKNHISFLFLEISMIPAPIFNSKKIGNIVASKIADGNNKDPKSVITNVKKKISNRYV